VHGDFETIAEINVHNLAGDAIEHKVGRMAIAQTENVADHGHDGERSGIVSTAIEPCFRGFGFEPEHAIEILAGCVVKRISKDFDLLHERKAVVVRRHLQHNSVLNVEKNLATIAVLSDEHMQRVTVRDEAQQTGLCAKRNGGIALDIEMALS
jgi:hypothetical protein